jgi:hypothetical protein
MKRHVLALIAVGGLLSGGFLLTDEISASSQSPSERRVNANLMQVKVAGRWEELPLMPLAEHACDNGDAHMQRYCN